MSGITGVWNLDGADVDRVLLDRMAASMAHRGADGLGTRILGPVGLACQLFCVTPEAVKDKQPVTAAFGHTLVWDGRLDNREELIPSLMDLEGVGSSSTDALIVLAAFERFGRAFLEKLAGDFAFALFDSRSRTLILARDVLGVRPLHYSQQNRAFLFASEIKALLAHPSVPRRPDEDALADFFLGARHEFSRGRTFFEGIRSVLPGEALRVTVDSVESYRYWDFDPGKKVRFGSFGQYSEGFRHHFETAVRRRMRSAYPVGVALSGGVDSSAVFCVAEALRQKAPATFPPLLGVAAVYQHAAADERSFLADIQRQYSCAITQLAMGPNGFLDGCGDYLERVEAPYLNPFWKVWDKLLEGMQSQGARVLLSGEFGDQVLFETEYLVDLFRRGAWGKMIHDVREFPQWFTDSAKGFYPRGLIRSLIRHHIPNPLLQLAIRIRNRASLPADRPWFAESLRTRARNGLHRMNRRERRNSNFHAMSMYDDARSGYHYLMLERHNKLATSRGLEPAFPLLDRDLVSFLMAIPGEIQTPDGVPKGLLRRALTGSVPASILQRRWKGNPTDILNQGAILEFDKVLRYLDFRAQSGRMVYLNGPVLHLELQHLRGKLKGNALASWSVRDMVALEMWVESFFEAD